MDDSKIIDTTRTGRIATLEGWRFIACCVVMLSHFEFLADSPVGDIYSTFLHNARGGVDYFFVLSGFGMMLAYLRRKGQHDFPRQGKFKQCVRYAWGHIVKLYPVYVLFIVVGIPLYFYQMLEWHPVCASAGITVAKALFAATLLQSATGLMTFSHAINGVGWFISTLFIIYLICPLLLKLIDETCQERKVILVVLITVIAAVASSYILGYLEIIFSFNDLVYGSPYGRVFYVAFGMTIAKLYQQKLVKGCCEELLCRIGVCSSITWFLMRNMLAPMMSTLVYAVDLFVCGALVLGLSTGDGCVSKFLGSACMRRFGKLSMYLYLSHYLVRSYVDAAFIAFELRSPLAMVFECAVIIVISFSISIAIKELRERGYLVWKTTR